MGFAIAIALLCAEASARDFDLRGSDVRIVGETTWAGGGWGGYHPIRFEITNFGPGRDLELRFEPHERGRGTPTVRRRLRIEQNATARVTLAVPLVGGRNSGRIDAFLNGVHEPALSLDVALAAPANGEFPQPSLLIVSPDEVPTDGFETAVAAAMQIVSDPAYPPGHFLSRRMGAGDSRLATVDPTTLPASWIDYTAVDLVAIRLDELQSLRPEKRTALLDWVATGGRLIVDGVAATPAESEPLRRSLAAVAAGDGEPIWRPANVAERRPLPLIFEHVPGGGAMIPNEGNPLSIAADVLPPEMKQQIEMLEAAIGQPSSIPTARPTWSDREPPFFVRRVGFGRIAAVTGDVFAANGADWTWLLNDLGGPAITWPVRQGMVSGRGDIEFIYQPIPGVRGVPTAAFLVLMTLFTLAIGPVSYIWLWRRDQLSRLVVTVPAIAAVASLLLFGYAAVSHGFATKGRVRSVTLLDSSTGTATTVSRIALFAGRAPSSGLTFSNETAVYPLYPFRQEFIDGEVDWTDAQTLTGGWLKTRTRTQFVTMTRRDERGRLSISPAAGGLRVVNGLEVPLTYLLVTDDRGDAFLAERLPAGGEAIARPLTDVDWMEIREFALDRIPELPDGLTEKDITGGLWGELPWRWHERNWQPRFRESLLERHLARLIGQAPGSTDAPETPESTENEYANPTNTTGDVRVDRAVVEDTIDPLARPRSFLAVAGDNPGVDLGGLDVDERESLHVVMGRW